MLIPYKWLNEYTNIDCGAHELARRMTFTGSKAESVAELGKDIENVVAGKLLTFDKHPDADKLYVSEVDVGGGKTVQIVTGATNIKAGDIVPVALDKSTLPGGLHIKATKMRGIISQGMMCSIDELRLSKTDYPGAPEDGILVLDASCAPGADIKEILGIDDQVIDFEITTNRPDCLSVLGLAREAAATTGAGFAPPPVLTDGLVENAAGTAKKTVDMLSVELQNSDLCNRYTARAVTGVAVGESPEWMKIRLRNSGIRPINNIVDVTNYVMLETGQPLHAFDARFIAGGAIIVRTAKKGESIITLDGDERALEQDMLIIADAEKPVAVAGVMGGEKSGIFSDTETVIIEAANFDGISVRRTARRLGLRTESSSRFEKGLDPNMTVPAADRAAELIKLLGAGDIAQGYVDVYPNKRAPVKIRFSHERINALLGTDISRGDILALLKKADLEYDERSNEIVVPTYRTDISMEADLAEETARFYDYNNIKATLRPGTVTTVGVLTPLQRLKRVVTDAMLTCGFSEVYTFSFQDPKVYDKLLLPADSPLRDAVKVANPVNEETGLMRTTALPDMLKIISYNYSQRIDSAAFFELASVYGPAKRDAGFLEKTIDAKAIDVNVADGFLPVQKSELSFGAYGSGNDFYTMKGAVQNLLAALGIFNPGFIRCRDFPCMHPGRAAYVTIGKKPAGYFGEINPEIQETFSLPEHALAGAISLDDLFKTANIERSYKPLPKYPPAPRDLAVLVAAATPAGDILEVIKKSGGALLEETDVFDVYTGSQVPDGQKSVAFSLLFRSAERTLTDAEVSSRMAKIVEALGKEFGATLRA